MTVIVTSDGSIAVRVMYVVVEEGRRIELESQLGTSYRSLDRSDYNEIRRGIDTLIPARTSRDGRDRVTGDMGSMARRQVDD